jgi:hypothetical protein
MMNEPVVAVLIDISQLTQAGINVSSAVTRVSVARTLSILNSQYRLR